MTAQVVVSRAVRSVAPNLAHLKTLRYRFQHAARRFSLLALDADFFPAMRCPHCDSPQVKYSRSGNTALPWLARLFAVCVRCHLCGRKFYCRSALLGGPTFRSKAPPHRAA